MSAQSSSREIKLSLLCKENPKFKEMFKRFAARKREPRNNVTDIQQIRYAMIDGGVKNLEPRDVRELFNRLQECELGTIVQGRNNRPTRFIWNFTIKSVGRVALNPKEKLQPREVPGALPQPISSVQSSKPKANIGLVKVYVLRSGAQIKVLIPAGLSDEQIANIPSELADAFSVDF